MRRINPYRMFQGAFIPNGIMRCRDLSQSAKLVWARLAQYAGKDGKCFPKMETIAEEVGLSVSGVRKVIKELSDFGLIKIVRPTGRERLMHRPNEYHFLDHEIFHGNDVFSGESADGLPVETPDGLSLDSPSAGGPIEENQLRESEEEISMSGNESRTPKKKKFWGEEEDHQLAREMYKDILVVNQTVKEPNWDRWANDIRLMRVQDGRSLADIRRVFRFANRDQFWCHNVLSPGSLRKHYPKLAPKAGMARSTVRGAGTEVIDHGSGRTCGECQFAGKGMKLCNGDDADPGHKACDLFREKVIA